MLTVILVYSCGSETKTDDLNASETKTGDLYAVKTSFGLGDALDGRIEKMDYEGIVVIKLDDGTEMDAYCEKKLFSQLRGGMKLEITKIENTEEWKVVRIIEEDLIDEETKTQETTAQIIGKFVDEDSGKPLQINIHTFLIDYPEGQTYAEEVEFDSLCDKIEWKFEYDSTKAFIMTIENVVPGTYSLVERDLGVVATAYGVKPGKVVDLRVINVKK